MVDITTKLLMNVREDSIRATIAVNTTKDILKHALEEPNPRREAEDTNRF